MRDPASPPSSDGQRHQARELLQSWKINWSCCVFGLDCCVIFGNDALNLKTFDDEFICNN
jgi:hypothetical protein